jgi:hypothetical protein
MDMCCVESLKSLGIRVAPNQEKNKDRAILRMVPCFRIFGNLASH